jgi:hypothetical protein
MLEMGMIEEAPRDSKYVYPFPNRNDYTLRYKPVSSEKFYRRKNQELLINTYRVLITHKHSFFDGNFIDAYMDILKYGNPIKKNLLSFDDQIGSVIEYFSDVFKPPFSY